MGRSNEEYGRQSGNKHASIFIQRVSDTVFICGKGNEIPVGLLILAYTFLLLVRKYSFMLPTKAWWLHRMLQTAAATLLYVGKITATVKKCGVVYNCND